MQWLAADVPEAHRDMLQLITKYPLKTDKSVIKQELNFKAWYLSIEASAVSDAKKSMDNAYSLVTNKKLPTETRPRDINVDEIVTEIGKALIRLEMQVKDSFSRQEKLIKWAKEQDDPEVKSESTINGLIEAFDDYRARISNVITKLDFILSYGKQKVIPSS